MLSLYGFVLDIPRQDLWLAPALGLVSTALTLAVGRALGNRRGRALAAPPQPRGPVRYEPVSEVRERRTSLRRRGPAVQVLVDGADPDGELWECWVLDRSTGGLGIAVPQLVVPGAILRVRTPFAPDTIPWVEVEVRRCQQTDDYWEIGVQFLQEQPWSVLLLFG